MKKRIKIASTWIVISCLLIVVASECTVAEEENEYEYQYTKINNLYEIQITVENTKDFNEKNIEKYIQNYIDIIDRISHNFSHRDLVDQEEYITRNSSIIPFKEWWDFFKNLTFNIYGVNKVIMGQINKHKNQSIEAHIYIQLGRFRTHIWYHDWIFIDVPEFILIDPL